MESWEESNHDLICFYLSLLHLAGGERERASRLVISEAGLLGGTWGEGDESIIFTQWVPGASCSPIIYTLYLITSLLNIGSSVIRN